MKEEIIHSPLVNGWCSLNQTTPEEILAVGEKIEKAKSRQESGFQDLGSLGIGVLIGLVTFGFSANASMAVGMGIVSFVFAFIADMLSYRFSIAREWTKFLALEKDLLTLKSCMNKGVASEDYVFIDDLCGLNEKEIEDFFEKTLVNMLSVVNDEEAWRTTTPSSATIKKRASKLHRILNKFGFLKRDWTTIWRTEE